MSVFIKNKDMFDEERDVLIITTNSYINKKEELVMGRGIALQLTQKYHQVKKVAGEIIKRKYGHLSKYGFLFLSLYDKQGNFEEDVGLFQVKYHFKDRANIELIKYSTKIMQEKLQDIFRTHYKYLKFAMNFPGIGYGGLNREDVFPIINSLPDNFYIYERR